MKLSVIVPVYNMAAEGKLQYCMDSLIGQTVEDYEILAVDDASTDNSLEILKEYERRFPKKVRVIHYERNKRQGGAKNEGLRAAQGEWIGFIDSDDWVTPDYYERLLKKAEETGADIVGCDYSMVSTHTMVPGEKVQNNTAEQTGVLTPEQYGKLIMRPGSMVLKIYKHSVIRENGLHFPEGIFYEDNCAASVWFLYFKHFEMVEEPLYFYYQHQTSTVHRISEERCRDRMKAGKQLLAEMKSGNFLEAYEKEIEYRFTELYFVNTLFSYMLGVKKKKLSFVKELRAGMLGAFPKFQENAYYLRHTGEEEKRMVKLLMRSPAGFFFYYRALWSYRNMKNRLVGKEKSNAQDSDRHGKGRK